MLENWAKQSSRLPWASEWYNTQVRLEPKWLSWTQHLCLFLMSDDFVQMWSKKQIKHQNAKFKKEKAKSKPSVSCLERQRPTIRKVRNSKSGKAGGRRSEFCRTICPKLFRPASICRKKSSTLVWRRGRNRFGTSASRSKMKIDDVTNFRPRRPCRLFELGLFDIPSSSGSSSSGSLRDYGSRGFEFISHFPAVLLFLFSFLPPINQCSVLKRSLVEVQHYSFPTKIRA